MKELHGKLAGILYASGAAWRQNRHFAHVCENGCATGGFGYGFYVLAHGTFFQQFALTEKFLLFPVANLL